MAYKNILKDLHRCIELDVPERVPCFPLGLDFDIADVGFTHREFRTDPDVMLEVAVKSIERYDYDWFLLHPDDLIEYENCGITIKYDEHIPPAVSEYMPAKTSTLKNLRDLCDRKNRCPLYRGYAHPGYRGNAHAHA
jgi:hypothetical protein